MFPLSGRRSQRVRIHTSTSMLQGSCLENNWKYFLLSVFLFLVMIKLNKSVPLTVKDCGTDFRNPGIMDIFVDCGAEFISLAIRFCPIVYSGYNEKDLILNKVVNNPVCQGTVDVTASPPLVRFTIPLKSSNACESTLTVNSDPGADSSSGADLKSVIVGGLVQLRDITTDSGTHPVELKYKYFCTYPLKYLIRNSE